MRSCYFGECLVLSKSMPIKFTFNNMSQANQVENENRACEIGDETNFTCDGCRKHMLAKEECWVVKDDVPIYCGSSGFCLCLNCYPSQCDIESTLKPPNKKGYQFMAQDIFSCPCLAHRDDMGSDSDATEEPYDRSNIFRVAHPDEVDPELSPQDEPCRCRCAVCNKPGWGSDHKNSIEGCETTWYLGRARGFRHVGFLFLCCPDCVPSIIKESGSQTKASGEFSRKWFQPHLTNAVLEDEFFVGNISISDNEESEE